MSTPAQRWWIATALQFVVAAIVVAMVTSLFISLSFWRFVLLLAVAWVAIGLVSAGLKWLKAQRDEEPDP